MRTIPIAFVLLAACIADPELGELEAEVAVPLTQPQTILASQWWTRMDNAEMATAVAFANLSSSRERYVVAARKKAAPYALEYFLVDGRQTNTTFGKIIGSPIQPVCGGPPCGAISLFGGTTHPTSATTSQAVIVTSNALFGDDPNDPNNPNSGYALMQAHRISATGVHGYQDLLDCRNFSATGGPLPPDCKVAAISHASSLRRDGTDKVLAAYLVATDITQNDWRLGAILFTPGGAQVNLPHIKFCQQPTCTGSTFYILHSETSYNRLANQFLVVWAMWPTASPSRAYAQRYDGTTGAPIGTTIQLGPVGSANGFPIDQQYAGVASNPNAAQNPNAEWVAFVDDKRYQIRPDGTFTVSALAPGADIGNWTLDWVSSPDGRAYERLRDLTTVATSERYLPTPGSPVSAPVAPNASTRAEAIAHRLDSNHSLALWSGTACFAGIPCTAALQWRMIDH